jgi:hypothetical protein
MSDKLDEAMKSYFSDRQEPPSEIKEALRDKLNAANNRREIKLCWAVIAYTVILAALFTFGVRIFTGSGFMTFICAFYFMLLSFSGAAIILVCQVGGINIKNIKLNRREFKCYFL